MDVSFFYVKIMETDNMKIFYCVSESDKIKYNKV